MAPAFRIGLYAFPQAAPYAAMLDVARRAEGLGFDSLWVADETPMAYPGTIGFEAFASLAALARDTTRIMLGTLVTPVVLRHPLLTAMAAATVDQASGGRFILGMGVGGVPADNAGVGEPNRPAAELVERLDEQLDTIDRLLRGETVTREGGFYPTRDAVVERPVQQPRPALLVAAQGRRSLEVAARRADIWNSTGGQPIVGDPVTRAEALAVTRRHCDILGEACAAIGRDPATIRRSLFAWRSGAYASIDAVEEWVGQYRELGFEEFIFIWPGEPAKDAVVEHVASDIAPRFRVG